MPSFANVLEYARHTVGADGSAVERAQSPMDESMNRLFGFSADTLIATLPQPRVENRAWPGESTSGSSFSVSVDPAAATWTPSFSNALELATEPARTLAEYTYWYMRPRGQSAVSGFSGEAQAAPSEPAAAVQVVDAPDRSMVKREAVNAPQLDLTDPRQKLATQAESLLGYARLRKEVGGAALLMRVLAKLEIDVLDKASVFAYKQQMAEHFRTARKLFDPTWRLTPLSNYTQPVPEFVLRKAVDIKQELPSAEFYIEHLKEDPFLIVSLEPLRDYQTSSNTLDRFMNDDATAYIEVWAEPKFEAAL